MKKLLWALSGIALILLLVVGYLARLTFLTPIPVKSNWDIKGFSDLPLNDNFPRYHLAKDGSLSPPSTVTLERDDQILFIEKEHPSPRIVNKVNSIAFKRFGKIYVLELSTGELRGFKE